MENKFQTLLPWMDSVLGAIWKDIKRDYLPKDGVFYKTYFGNRPQNRLSTEEVREAFVKELTAGNEEMEEWVVNRWVFQHGDIYDHFADRLSKISENFDEIQSLSAEQSEAILKGAVEAYGARDVYFFSVLNGVVFPKPVFDTLKERAAVEKEFQMQKSAEAEVERDLAKAKAAHEREVARLEEKYEQKIAGVMKKYTSDIEGLKSQIRSLQKQLQAGR